ncbi:MAG: hypothetical protein ACR2NU_01255 [Aeoliella sp.]
MKTTQSSVVAPKSTVLAQATVASAASANWLESATLTYSRHAAPTVQEDIVQAKFSAVPSSTDGTLAVLAIRYPHPDGHKDRARVELVITDPENAAQANSWYRRLGQTLSETLPGMAWGEGIQQVKAIDLRLDELQQLIVESQTAVSLGNTHGQTSPQIQLETEINGRRNVAKSGPILALEKLALRAAQEGKLVGYSGSANELRQRFGPEANAHLADQPNSHSITEPTARQNMFPSHTLIP